MPKRAKIIPIAAGKGGVGKTFLTANLAIALSQAGHRTIAVDMDLGSSNLHSFLGIANRYPGIGDYLMAKNARLEELLVPTAVEQLVFLPGDGKSPFMANIAHVQKMKLMQALSRLPADYILLDLGAGSSFNTLDYFGMAPQGVLVTTAEPPAIVNMLVFMKNYLLRTINKAFGKEPALVNCLREIFKRPMETQMDSIDTLKKQLARIEPDTEQKIVSFCRSIRPRVVFNFGEEPEDLKLAAKIDKSLQDVLGLEADYFGFIYYDHQIRRAVRRNLPFLLNYRDTAAAAGITKIAERIDKYWDRPIKDSAGLLMRHVQQEFEKSKQAEAQ